MEQRISLVTLGVGDLARSRAFYERLGWQRAMKANDGVAFFQLGGIGLSLYPRANLAADTGVDAAGQGFGGIVLAHNVRTREEVAPLLAAVEAAGGKILKPAHDVFWGGHVGNFADPDGHLWEVAWNPAFPI